MKSQSLFFVESSHKTKTWWMFLSVLLFVFIPFLIVLLLCGEFNLLGNNWLIAKNASVWHGFVTSDKIDYLAQKYHIFFSDGGIDALKSELLKWVDKTNQATINAYKTFFNPIILAPLCSLLFVSLVYPMIFNATKISGLDILPFSIGIGSFMFILTMTGLIDQWGQSLLSVYWLVRIVIALIGTITIYLLTNYFVNKFIANRPYATDVYFGYRSVDKQNADVKQQLKENIDSYKKQDSDESFVEVEEGQ